MIVSGVDLLDNTPILDIKPYLPYADAYPEASGSYGEALKAYRLQVNFPKELIDQIPIEKQNAVIACLADDPRPSYQHNPERIYHMQFSTYDIDFQVTGEQLTVIGLRNSENSDTDRTAKFSYPEAEDSNHKYQ